MIHSCYGVVFKITVATFVVNGFLDIKVKCDVVCVMDKVPGQLKIVGKNLNQRRTQKSKSSEE